MALDAPFIYGPVTPCRLCRRCVLTWYRQSDPRLRYETHTAVSGPRCSRECDASEQFVYPENAKHAKAQS